MISFLWDMTLHECIIRSNLTPSKLATVRPFKLVSVNSHNVIKTHRGCKLQFFVFCSVFQIKWNKKGKHKYLRCEVFMAVKI